MIEDLGELAALTALGVELEVVEDPPIGRDVQVKSLVYMPLHVADLLSSPFWIKSTGDEKGAAISLWCTSWHQQPAGSLKCDNEVLAHIAGYARDPEGWAKVKNMALSGFQYCKKDKRLYHPKVVGIARENFEKHEADKANGSKGGKKRWGKDKNQGELLLGNGEPDSPPNSPPNSPSDSPPNSELIANKETNKEINKETNTVGTHKRVPATAKLLSDDWKLSDTGRAYAKLKGLKDSEIDIEAEKFKNHWLSADAKKGARRSWERTWYTWVMNAIEFRGRVPNMASVEAGGLKEKTFPLPVHGEVVTPAMCPAPVMERHIGQVFILQDSQEWGAWIFHLNDTARKANKPAPIINALVGSKAGRGWTFPTRWPPGHPGSKV